jgi:hypothetical protein
MRAGLSEVGRVIFRRVGVGTNNNGPYIEVRFDERLIRELGCAANVEGALRELTPAI